MYQTSSLEDLGLCSLGCQCRRYQLHIQNFHPFFPGVVPPPHLYRKQHFVYSRETAMVADPNSNDLKAFKKWMPLDPTNCMPKKRPIWNP